MIVVAVLLSLVLGFVLGGWSSYYLSGGHVLRKEVDALRVRTSALASRADSVLERAAALESQPRGNVSIELGGVLGEVLAERARQDELWGEHAPSNFEMALAIRTRADAEVVGHVGPPRRFLVEIAALAVAGIESIDRKAQVRP